MSRRSFGYVLVALADRLDANVGDKVFLADFSKSDMTSAMFAPLIVLRAIFETRATLGSAGSA